MKLSLAEFRAMNNPFRQALQNRMLTHKSVYASGLQSGMMGVQ
jgi:hypothetical protein